MTYNTIYMSIKRIVIYMNDGYQGKRNMPLHDNNILIWKGLNNIFDFHLKNLDRQPIPLRDSYLECNIYDKYTQKVVFTKRLKIIDDTTGIAKLNVEPWEISNIEDGTYQYAITYNMINGKLPIMLSRGSNIIGDVEIKTHAAVSPFINSNIIDQFTETFIDGQLYYVSGIIPGSITVGNTTDLHTCALYCDNFTGRIIVEGSLTPNIPEISQLFRVNFNSNDNFTLTDFTGIETFNIVAPLTWLRIRYTNSNGKMNKILIRS